MTDPTDDELVVVMPADGNWLAQISRKGGRRMVFVPVTAWCDAGYALIVDRKRGRLVRAANDGAFIGLVRRRPQDADRDLEVLDPEEAAGEEAST